MKAFYHLVNPVILSKELLDFPFCREHALDPRVQACGLVQGAAEGLEDTFEHVVDIAAV